MALIVVLLLAAVVFGSNQRVSQARVAELERMTDAMSEALESNVLADPSDKLERILTDMARAGEFKEISVADNSGKIMASTNAARKGTQSDAMKVSTNKARAERRDGLIIVRRAIILAGDTRFGNLEIRVTE